MAVLLFGLRTSKATCTLAFLSSVFLTMTSLSLSWRSAIWVWAMSGALLLPGNLQFPIPMMKNIAIAAAAMPPAAAYMTFLFTIAFFAFADALKLSINPKCLY